MQTKISGTGLTKITDHWSKSIVDLAIDSARQAISESNTSPDMIIFANTLSSYSSSQENLSTIISEELGLSDITTFKIESSSCSGAMAVNIGHKLLNSDNLESVLIIGAEKMTDLSPAETITAENRILASSLLKTLQKTGERSTSILQGFETLQAGDHPPNLSFFEPLVNTKTLLEHLHSTGTLLVDDLNLGQENLSKIIEHENEIRKQGENKGNLPKGLFFT